MRLVKGAFEEPPEVAYEAAQDIDLVRALAEGAWRRESRSIATHDPRPHRDCRSLAVRTSRERRSMSSRCCSGSALRVQNASLHPARRFAFTCHMARSGTHTWFVEWRRSPRTFALFARAGRPRMTAVALVGGGKMGEALLWGLIEADHSVVV